MKKIKSNTLKIIFLVTFLFPLHFIFSQENPVPMVVKVPVANIRNQPIPHNGTYAYDDLQETQVELGEPVLVWEKKGKWARVECADQMEYTHNDRWQGYPGWIELKNLSSDLSLLHEIKKSTVTLVQSRQIILEKAAQHIDHPYLWGGRSLYDPRNKTVATGVDCSGLVNWSYKQAGFKIPRDAHEQFMKAKIIDPSDLQPADLIFLAKKEKPEKIVHVMLYAGDENIIEAPQSGEKVRKITFQNRFQKNKNEIKNKELIGDRVVYFGTLFVEGK